MTRLHPCSCSAAGRLLICRHRGQLNFPCDSCCSHCRQSSLQCSHLPPLARCANHFRVAINRSRFPKTRSHYSHNLITKYRILTAWRSNTSTCSYCRHSAESAHMLQFIVKTAVICSHRKACNCKSVWCVYLKSFFPEVTCDTLLNLQHFSEPQYLLRVAGVLHCVLRCRCLQYHVSRLQQPPELGAEIARKPAVWVHSVLQCCSAAELIISRVRTSH